MQYPFSCRPEVYNSIENSLSKARLARFLSATNNDKQAALRLCIWNARVCEAFYLPIQLTEITLRNSICIPINKRFGSKWYDDHRFVEILPIRLKDELHRTVQQEKQFKGTNLTQNHIVSGLSLGFWLNLLTQNYKNHLWANGLKNSFPNIHKNTRLKDIHKKAEKFRIFRNKVFHHSTIFDQSPSNEYANMRELLGWMCENTLWLLSELSKTQSVIGQRPKV